MMVTNTQFNTFDKLLAYYNEALFAGTLPDCMVIPSRHSTNTRLVKPEQWKDTLAENRPLIHEISINSARLGHVDADVHAELVYGMVLVWQQEYGNPSRRGYTNQERAKKMEAIGLMPTSTGEPGGKKQVKT